MRLNKFIAQNTALSRRNADMAIEQGKVTINDQTATLGSDVAVSDIVTLDGMEIKHRDALKSIILLNKPVGYVCSKDGQGSNTVYELLPQEYSNFNIAGRLDKDSCGLVLLTNDGKLLYELTHPSQNKQKIYEVELDKPLSKQDKIAIEQGIQLEDGPSMLKLENLNDLNIKWRITMHEGRNRQIRRTFSTLGYEVVSLFRISIGNYSIAGLEPKQHQLLNIQ